MHEHLDYGAVEERPATAGPFLGNLEDGKRSGDGRDADGADPRRSLAHIRPGDVVEVTGVIFEIVRNRCWEAGIRPGEIFECREIRDGSLVLAQQDGSTVTFERHHARFVSTRPLALSIRGVTHPPSASRTGKRTRRGNAVPSRVPGSSSPA